ncbi:hypothetical protein [uncultured Ruminococcus sp.]|nr:hypothetical protein [uncultured Ruminococcus sp.]
MKKKILQDIGHKPADSFSLFVCDDCFSRGRGSEGSVCGNKDR